MPVLIDYRVCDNAPGCGASRVCPTGAIAYDHGKNKVLVDSGSCIDCENHPCTRYCPAGAVKFAASHDELERLKAEIESSSLSRDDLLEEKYGVRPGDPKDLGPNLIHVDDGNFAAEVLNSPLPVVVDFWAEWCAPCRILAPTFKSVAAEYDGRVRFAKLDTEEAAGTAARYGIMSIPTMLFFADGRVVDQAVGALPAAALRQKVDRLLLRG